MNALTLLKHQESVFDAVSLIDGGIFLKEAWALDNY